MYYPSPRSVEPDNGPGPVSPVPFARNAPEEGESPHFAQRSAPQRGSPVRLRLERSCNASDFLV